MTKKTPATPVLITPLRISRRSLMKIGFSAGLLPLSNIACSSNTVKTDLWTPKQTEGPFYPVHEQMDKDVDLTHVKGRRDYAKGEVVNIQGRVLDTNGAVLDRVFIEIWQANTWGRYRHRRDPNQAPLDPNFQGWGQTRTDANGKYSFKTILPGAYPAGPNWTRPPHIHFKVAKQGYHDLTTQMYFPDQDLNDEDLILNDLPEPQQKMVIAKRTGNDSDSKPMYQFDIVLRVAV